MVTKLQLKQIFICLFLFNLFFVYGKVCLAFDVFNSKDDRNRLTKEEKEKYLNENIFEPNLVDWDGIVFHCPTLKKKEYNNICENSKLEAKFLAASSKIELQIAENYFDRSVYQYGYNKDKRRLLLEIELFPSNEIMGIISIYFRFVVLTSFNDAISKSRLDDAERFKNFIKLHPEKNASYKQPKVIPRSGDLVIYVEDGLAIGSANEKENLISEVSKRIEVFMKQFFVRYLNANNKNQ